MQIAASDNIIVIKILYGRVALCIKQLSMMLFSKVAWISTPGKYLLVGTVLISDSEKTLVPIYTILSLKKSVGITSFWPFSFALIDFIISQNETYSKVSFDSRPLSPYQLRITSPVSFNGSFLLPSIRLLFLSTLISVIFWFSYF